MNHKEKYIKYKNKYLQLKSKTKSKSNNQVGGLEIIPSIGLGTWQTTPNDSDIYTNIITALETGYRCFDCAYWYHNQKGIGRAFEYAFTHMHIRREDLYIIGKGNSYREILESLVDLKIEYFDLSLIHHSFQVDLEKIWSQDFTRLKTERKSINIGLSNLYENKLKRFICLCKTKGYEIPYAIEDEINIFNVEVDLVNYCNQNDIRIIAYTPLGQYQLLNAYFGKNPLINRLMQKYSLTQSQIFLLWLARRNIITIPSSSKREHMLENLLILTLLGQKEILTDVEVEEINSIGFNSPLIETAAAAKEFDNK